MYLNNTTFRVTDFRPETNLAIEWVQASNDNYVPISYLASNDEYNTIITTAGTESYINTIIQQLDLTLDSTNIVTMSGFASDETVFGEDITHTTLSGIILDWGISNQKSWHGFNLSLKIRCMSPTSSVSGSLPAFSGLCLSHSSRMGSIPETINNFSYTGEAYTAFNGALDSTCEFECNLTTTQLAGLRRWMVENRGTSFSTASIGGLVEPFGPQAHAASYTIRILDLKEVSKFNIDRWLVRLKVANIV